MRSDCTLRWATRLLAMGIMSTLLMAGLGACTRSEEGASAGSAATASVVRANADMAKSLNLADLQDMDDAKRGFVAKPSGRIMAADGMVLRDFDAYGFLDGPSPDTVNPSLWRHAQINAQVGLFKVTDGVYQLRGFDIANMTLIEGDTGLIVVDPLSARESASFALAFARQHLGNKPVTGLIMTHAHADHFGGALGVILSLIHI